MRIPDLPYCRLKREVLEGEAYSTHTEDFDSFDKVWSTLSSVAAEHAARNLDVGSSCTLLNAWKRELIVGISVQGWVLIIRNATTIDVVFSLRESGEYVGFMIPEWTEFPQHCLHDEGDAKVAIRRWLDTGSMDLFLVPGRRLEYPFGQGECLQE